MEIIHGGRASGKTAKLIQLVKESGGVLVVSSLEQKRRLVRNGILKEEQVAIFRRIKFLGSDKPYYIDNMDGILYELFGKECSGVSMTHFHSFECGLSNVK